MSLQDIINQSVSVHMSKKRHKDLEGKRVAREIIHKLSGDLKCTATTMNDIKRIIKGMYNID